MSVRGAAAKGLSIAGESKRRLDKSLPPSFRFSGAGTYYGMTSQACGCEHLATRGDLPLSKS